MVNLLQGLLSDLKSTLMYNLVSFHSLGFSEQGGKSHYVPSVDQLMHAAVEGESRRWVGEVREGQKERAEGMCGSQETTKALPHFKALLTGNGAIKLTERCCMQSKQFNFFF